MMLDGCWFLCGGFVVCFDCLVSFFCYFFVFGGWVGCIACGVGFEGGE